jgi:hypothetical protein
MAYVRLIYLFGGTKESTDTISRIPTVRVENTFLKFQVGCLCIYIYIYIYIYMCVCVCVYIYIYIYIESERESEGGDI